MTRRIDPTLPVVAVLDDVIEALRDVGAAVLVAPPGTGKTTGVPPALIDEPWARTGRIVMLEPRRIAARSAAGRMASVSGEKVGETFGYAVRGDRRSSSRTRVEVVTEGLFLRRLQSDPSLDGVSAVVIDELHERSLDVDTVLALLVDVRSSLRPDLRILAMSATIDARPVAALLTEATGPDVPVIEATAPIHPVTTHSRPGSAHDPLERRVAAVVAEAMSADPGDALVFLPGKGEIGRARRALDAVALPSGVDVVELHGSVSPAQQQAVLDGDPGGGRRIILATSIAETSITVPGVRIVVDSGRRRTVRSDPHTGLPTLLTEAVSRAGADQRRGRAGRVAPGTAYRLWSSEDDRHRPAADAPEIDGADLSSLVLQLRSWGVVDPAELHWLTAPGAESIQRAEQLLVELGALDEDGGRLTTLGRELAQIGMHPRLGAVAVTGRELGHTELAAQLAATLESSRSGSDDVVERVLQLRAGRGDRDATESMARWRRAMGGRSDQRRDSRSRDRERALDREQVEEVIARLMLAGYPDRVARRRSATRTDDRGRELVVFHLRTGGEVTARGFERSPWLVVADLDAGDRTAVGRAYLAVGLDEELVLDQLGDRVEFLDEVVWDRARGDVVATRQRRLGAVVLSTEPFRDPPVALVREALWDGIGLLGLGLLGGVDAADSLRARVACLAAVGAPAARGGWPDWSDRALIDSLQEWLAPFVDRARRRADLRRVDLRGALESRLGWEDRRALDQLAPTHWTLPSGQRVRIEYGALGGEPASALVSLRLRDVLGIDEHPTVAGGRVKVTIELLSPAGRPVQRTDDLPGFWRGSYAAVRSEMRGRYPKHPWPERPWEPR